VRELCIGKEKVFFLICIFFDGSVSLMFAFLIVNVLNLFCILHIQIAISYACGCPVFG
jgi:hypothetical protein